jgi:glycosyltransferase involved in cell wall biosynthesis
MTLHVAALPYPSPQGTQAALRFLLEALPDATLLAYGHGDGSAPTVPLERAPRLSRSASLRSGPSAGKLLDDLGLALAVRRHRGPVVAHHVEAAAACLLAGVPYAFVAHTDLGPELPTYLPPRWAPLASRAGAAIDAIAIAGARSVAAVSPLLAARLARRTGRVVHPLPLPWPLPPPIDDAERRAARAALGLTRPTLLYAGNLDGYQGLEVLVRARALLPGLDALCATASEGTLPGFLRLPLATEAHRRLAHAAADVVVVPRSAPGGIPVKLLDGLSRGVPVAAVPRALAGHAIDAVELARRDDDARALGAAIDRVLSLGEAARRERAEAGRRHLAAHHTPSALRAAFAAFAGEVAAPLAGGDPGRQRLRRAPGRGSRS